MNRSAQATGSWQWLVRPSASIPVPPPDLGDVEAGGDRVNSAPIQTRVVEQVSAIPR